MLMEMHTTEYDRKRLVYITAQAQSQHSVHGRRGEDFSSFDDPRGYGGRVYGGTVISEFAFDMFNESKGICNASVYACMYVCVCMYICMYVCMYVCVYLCIYVSYVSIYYYVCVCVCRSPASFFSMS